MTLGATLFLVFLICQRLGELLLAKRNTTRLLAAGAREVAPGHYPLIVALHTTWLLCLVVYGHDAALRPIWLLAFVMLQGFRLWILLSLGSRWTTRIIVTDTPHVARGPYRWVNHPNYLLVVAEIAVAPMVLGLGWVAAVFSVLNAAVLAIRVRAEDHALRPLGP